LAAKASLLFALTYNTRELIVTASKRRRNNMLDIIGQLVVGLIVGVLARLVLPGREAFPPGALGWLLTALLGIAGAFVGSMIARSLWADAGYAAGWIMSIIGAILLLLLVRMLFGRGGTATTV
jgi:uncharacterized membrane protein YeaQ/YmgE (transglycosylase-associated protein family)